MFLLPTAEGGEEVEGGSEGKPIELEGFQAVDFDALLRILYPTCASATLSSILSTHLGLQD